MLSEVRLANQVKRMNQRLQQLRKSGLTNAPAYKAIERLYYDDKSYLTVDKSGNFKFRTDLSRLQKESPQGYKALQQQLDKFENAKTSTVRGVNAINLNNYEKYKKKTGYSGSYNDYLDFWSSKVIEDMKTTFDSDEIVSLVKKADVNKLSTTKLLDILKSNRYYSVNDDTGDIEVHFAPLREIINDINELQNNSGDIDDEQLPFT